MSDRDVDELLDDETEADDEFERPTKEESTIGRVAAGVLTMFPKPLLRIRGTMYKRMAIKSIENYHKIAGGDAIGINAKPGQRIDLEPVLYRAPEETGEGEKPGWKVKGREKVWNPGKDRNGVNFLGRTPTVLLQDDDHVEAGWLAPRIGQAIEMDQYWPVFVGANINAVVDYQPGPAGKRAVADGGVTPNVPQIELELDHPGEWAGDNWIDLGSGDGYDGMVISNAKAREWQAEHVDSEQMQMQEERGRLMGLLGEDAPSVFKLLLLCAAIILGTLAIIFIGPELMGGDGGTSINPLMVNVLGSMGVF